MAPGPPPRPIVLADLSTPIDLDAEPGAPLPAPPALARPFVFVGTGGAYFRIWIVNLLLTICTFGLYSAWAKVRRLRFFYGNTLFDGSPFEFHGRPIALLRGRLVAAALLVAYSFATRFSIVAWLVVAGVLLVLLPWFLWKSLRFRLANTSYRGIRFAFDGTVVRAYVTFVPLILLFLGPAFFAFLTHDAAVRKTIGLIGHGGRLAAVVVIAIGLIPWLYLRLRAYQHRHARLGTAPFAFDGRTGGAYTIAFRIVVLGIGFVMLAGMPAAFAAAMLGRFDVHPMFSYVFLATSYLVFASGYSQPVALIQNYAWNHSRLVETRFTSTVGRDRLWWIMLVNFALTLVTLGLFWPFAVVRSTRYRLAAVAWAGDPTVFIAAGDQARAGASGEETADLFGLDLGL